MKSMIIAAEFENQPSADKHVATMLAHGQEFATVSQIAKDDVFIINSLLKTGFQLTSSCPWQNEFGKIGQWHNFTRKASKEVK